MQKENKPSTISSIKISKDRIHIEFESYMIIFIMKKILCALLLLATITALGLIESHQFFRRRWYSSNINLEFSYACNQQASLRDCKFAVEWRGNQIQEITPVDHNVHSLLLKVQVEYGKNTLRFVGKGNSATKGVGINHVSMTRTLHAFRCIEHQQLLNNTEFYNKDSSQPKTTALRGWYGEKYQIIDGKTSNNHWQKTDRICELGSGSSISQNVYIGRRHLKLTEETYLKFSDMQKILGLGFFYAPRQNTALEKNKFAVVWNGEVLQEITPTTYSPRQSYNLRLRIIPNAKNTLTLRGMGPDPQVGCTMHQFSMYREFNLFTKRGQSRGLLSNGWLEDQRFLISKEETIFDNGPSGWRGNYTKIEISSNVNPKWDDNTINHFPVCELVGHTEISQDFYFDKDYNFIKAPQVQQPNELTLQFSYAALPNADLSSSKFDVVFNSKVVASIAPSDYKKHVRTIILNAQVGTNSLHFIGRGNKKDKGAGISFISLMRVKGFRPINLVKNRQFTNRGMKKCSSEGWNRTNLTVLPGKSYGHSWDWRSRGCVCALYPQTDVSLNFELNERFQYVSERQKQLPLKTKKTLRLTYGYYPEKNSTLNQNKFAIEWNGKIIKQVTPSNLKQQRGNIQLEAHIGKNSLRIIGTGSSEGKGGGFNYIRLHRANKLLQPFSLISTYIYTRHYGDPCPKEARKWKGNYSIAKGRGFAGFLYQTCLVQLKKGQEIHADFTFNDKYQTI